MKTLRFFLIALSIVCIGMVLPSCLDDDDNSEWDIAYPNALVTVKTSGDSFFLQLDDNTTLFPANMTKSPFGNKEVRALINFREVDKSSEGYDKAVHINWMDSILTKQIAADLQSENDAVYGTDPVEMVNDWVTIAEDGYLTLRFRTLFGNSNTRHLVNLLASSDPENPYEVEFRHNAFGDIHGVEGDGLVAFDLSSLPDTNGKTVKLKLKWKSFSGDKSTEFDYCTRKATAGKSSVANARSVLNLK